MENLFWLIDGPRGTKRLKRKKKKTNCNVRIYFKNIPLQFTFFRDSRVAYSIDKVFLSAEFQCRKVLQAYEFEVYYSGLR